MDARKAPVRIWQLGNSAGADDGLIGRRLTHGNVVFVCQIDGADRDPQRNGYDRRNGEFALWVIAETRFFFSIQVEIPPVPLQGWLLFRWKRRLLEGCNSIARFRSAVHPLA